MHCAGVPAAKMRILCLHGYMQTGSVFRMKIGSLRKALKSRADFVFVDAPFQVPYLQHLPQAPARP
jgi:hypothetical protein